eukprot:Opistho-2@32930
MGPKERAESDDATQPAGRVDARDIRQSPPAKGDAIGMKNATIRSFYSLFPAFVLRSMPFVPRSFLALRFVYMCVCVRARIGMYGILERAGIHGSIIQKVVYSCWWIGLFHRVSLKMPLKVHDCVRHHGCLQCEQRQSNNYQRTMSVTGCANDN